MINNQIMNVRSTASFIGSIKKYNNRIIEIGNRYDERFKNTIVGKWIRYWKQLYIDYRDVAIEVRKDCRARPLKAASVFTGLGLLWVFAKTNPDEVNFRDTLLKATNDLILVSPSLQKPSSVQHLRLVETCYNKSMLRRQGFIFFSVMWVDNDSCDCNHFSCQCSYLEVPYLNLFRRIVDLGFVNRWWLLEKHLEDYDINY